MDVMKKVAQIHGVPVEIVKAEMRLAIRLAMANPSSSAKQLWCAVAPDGKEPTPEEFVRHVAGIVRLKQKGKSL